MNEEQTVYYISVKFETTNKSYTFSTTERDIYQGSHVVVETQYGLELGEVVSPLRLESGLESNIEVKPIVRKATNEDVAQYETNLKDAKVALKKCQQEADNLKLDMNIIRSEYTLDRSKITFIYVADERVDFRELLKVLANDFRCRIELRQIGARDKAKMISGIGPCGHELCCARFMTDFDMISINMAKNQLLALNVQKLSGHCGKLMCCLKYEDDTYKELRKDLPKINAQVDYEGNHYRITSINVIARNCKLENKETVIYISLDDLLSKGTFKIGNQIHEPQAVEVEPINDKPIVEDQKIRELEGSSTKKPDILDEVREIVKENKQRKEKHEKAKVEEDKAQGAVNKEKRSFKKKKPENQPTEKVDKEPKPNNHRQHPHKHHHHNPNSKKENA